MAGYYISNEYIKAGFSAKGAELVQLQNLENGRDYLWSGDPKYWNRVSPVLFPFVGKLQDQRYQYEGQWYEGIGQHAFARDQMFELVRQSAGEIWFALNNNEETRKMYPFAFSLHIGYRLEKKRLRVMWKVVNRGEKLYFSIGAHPAFLCPKQGSREQSMDGYFIDLGLQQSSVRSGILTDKGVLGERTKDLALTEGRLRLTESLFDEDALILDAGQIHSVSLQDPSGQAYLKMEFDAPLLGIWSPAGKHAPFVCIEPWYGRCDREGFNGTLQEREYGNELSGDAVFEREYSMEILD